MKRYIVSVTTVLIATAASPVFAQIGSQNKSSESPLSQKSELLVLSPEEDKKWHDIWARYRAASGAAYSAYQSEKYEVTKANIMQALQVSRETVRSNLSVSLIASTQDPQSIGNLSIVLANVYIKLGVPQEAVDVLRDNEMATRLPDYNSTIALAYCRLGKLEQARESLSRQYSGFLPTSPIASELQYDLPGGKTQHELEAKILFLRAAAKRFSVTSMPDLQDALQLAPRNPAIAYEIAAILQPLKLYKEAVPYLRIAADFGTGSYARRAKEKATNIEYSYSPGMVRSQQELEEEAKQTVLHGASDKP